MPSNSVRGDMLDDAKRFLSKVVGWDGTHYISLHHRIVGVKGIPGNPHLTMDAFLTNLAFTESRPNYLDPYFSVASQNEVKTLPAKPGRRAWVKALRTQANVHSIRSFFLDIDVKDGAYATQDDAADALQGFVDEMGMPPLTALVSSGTGGMHAYWSLEKPIGPDEWFTYAPRLVSAATEYGLLFDPECSVDVVRLLRIPQTRNFKTTPPSSVELLMLGDNIPNEMLLGALSTFASSTIRHRKHKPITSTAIPDAPDDLIATFGVTDMGNEFTASLEDELVRPTIEEVAAQCGFIAETLADHGAGYDEPKWYAALGIAAFVYEPEQAAYALSYGHASFSQSALDDKMEHRLSSGAGPTTCAKIQALGCKHCATCAHVLRSMNPVDIARLEVLTVAQAEYAEETNLAKQPTSIIPYGYNRGAKGHIYGTVIKDKKEHSVCVFPFDLVSAMCYNQEGTQNYTLLMQVKQVDEVVDITIPFRDLSDGSTAGKSLYAAGLVMPTEVPNTRFIMSFLTQLRNSRDTVATAKAFGWDIDAGVMRGFVYGGRLWGPTGDTAAVQVDPKMRLWFYPKGEMAYWKAAVDLITRQRRPGLDVILAAAFAGPLTHFTGLDGLAIGVYSKESGIGKTTALKVAQSVWGDPINGISSLSDTYNSIMIKVGQLNNLPVFYDEMKSSAQMDTFTQILFSLTGGKEKSRATQRAELANQRKWQTVMLYCSNNSLKDSIIKSTPTTVAGLVRLFEFVLEPSPLPKEEITMVVRAIAKLNENFGWAGLEYAKYIGSHITEVDALVHSNMQELEHLLQQRQEERYWVASMATIIAGAQIANELGLTDIGIENLIAFLVKEFYRMREEVGAAPNDMAQRGNVENLMGTFLNDKRARNTVYTNYVHIARGRPTKGGNAEVKIDLMRTNMSRLDAVQVQIGLENHIVRFTDASLTEWCKVKGIQRSAFIEAAKDKLGMTNVTGRLCGGTDMVQHTELLFQFSDMAMASGGYVE